MASVHRKGNDGLPDAVRAPCYKFINFYKKYLRFVKIYHRRELCAGFLPHEQIFLHPPGGGSSPCRRQGFHEKEKTG